MSGRAISARERRTIRLGAAVSLVAVVAAWAILPLARHWSAREAVIAAEVDRLARLRGLYAAEATLAAEVEARRRVLEAGPQRLLSGRTPPLAASALQSLLQDFADRSRVTVSRLDVAGSGDAAGDPATIPANVSAVGDIYGIMELLSLIQHGPRLLEVTELSIRPNPALRGELLQFTIGLRGAYVGS